MIAANVDTREGLIEKEASSVQRKINQLFSMPTTNVWKLIKTGIAIKIIDRDFRLNNIFNVFPPCFLNIFLSAMIATSIAGTIIMPSGMSIARSRTRKKSDSANNSA
jgi:hypothetical protein